MRIIQLTPGSGDNFYCENCLRDLMLVKALARAGHDISMVPMYLPIAMDAVGSAHSAPLFMGGLNVYLQQKFSLFRKTPRWLDAWFDHPALLKKLGRLSGMTTARELGKTTVSMLQGADGKQQKEINRLTDWLEGLDEKPDVIVFSNILLAGLAPTVKEKLKVPVVCLLQDEEGFLDGLPEPFRQRAWDMVGEKSRAFDAFIAVSDYYKSIIVRRLPDVSDRVTVMAMGIDPAAFVPAEHMPEIPTLGYLSKMCYDHGLDILINAVHFLRRDDRLDGIRLRITGGSGPADAGFLKKMRQRIESLRLTDRVEFVPEYDVQSRQAFLKSLWLTVLPSRVPLGYGLFALESLASGVPFVTPDAGVFTELAERTKAGVLYGPNNPVKLAETLRSLLLEPAMIRRLGQTGTAAVKKWYSVDNTVKSMVELFSALSSRKSGK